ncbi:hypothetical protein CGCS363_v015043 [Colletotrichum siamense]|uniref:uncharacterized protein n=1 Tax=Colletotrichum siamense TaxID=690259 RepID=UPI001872F393|nr:uncharacterized protein CGCS363_v015043 [Colletotrichum siamense]KAF5483054.1 hypothetical protein CGCS363_v015043 [Colletotrichum siamense]
MQPPVRTGLSQELVSDIVECTWFTNSPWFTIQANEPSLCVNTLGPGLLFPAYPDSKFRAMIQTIRPFLLRGPAEDEELLSWVPLVRARLTISVADKIIMIHRPVLCRSLYIPEFQRARTTCISAALTILQQDEKITEREGTISLWTHSAVCVTAAVVIGLDLLLCIRKCDIIAGCGAALIDAILGMEEGIVVKLMRADLRDVFAGRMQRNIISDVIASNEITARFLAVDPGDPSGMLIASPPGDFDPSLQTVCDSGTPSEGLLNGTAVVEDVAAELCCIVDVYAEPDTFI